VLVFADRLQIYQAENRWGRVSAFDKRFLPSVRLDSQVRVRPEACVKCRDASQRFSKIRARAFHFKFAADENVRAPEKSPAACDNSGRY